MISLWILLGILYFLVGGYVASISVIFLTAIMVAMEGDFPGWVMVPLALTFGLLWPVTLLILAIFFTYLRIKTWNM